MAISNVKVVNTTSKYIVKSTGTKSETDQELVDAEKLTEGTDGSKVSLIECYYIIESVGSTAGKLIIDVPNPYSIDRILKYLLFRTEHLGEDSHLIFYTPDSINRLLTKNNFIIKKIATDWEFESKKYWLIPKFFRNGLGSHLLVCATKK